MMSFDHWPLAHQHQHRYHRSLSPVLIVSERRIWILNSLPGSSSVDLSRSHSLSPAWWTTLSWSWWDFRLPAANRWLAARGQIIHRRREDFSGAHDVPMLILWLGVPLVVLLFDHPIQLHHLNPLLVLFRRLRLFHRQLLPRIITS